MAFSMAGLASTVQGYDQGIRQRRADEQASRNAQRDERKFDQEQRAADEQSRTEAILRGEEQGGLGSAAPQTNGSRIVDSVKGLFGVAPSVPPSVPESQPSLPNPDATKGQPGLAQTAPQSAVPLPYYKQAQARLDAYALKNPNDVNAIQAAQAKIDILAKGDADRSHAQFIKHGQGALQKFIASGGMNTSALDEVTTKHFPDGHTYSTARNDDGTYTVTQTDTGKTGKPMTFDEIGRKFSSLLHPDSYMSAHIKAQEVGLTEGAKLPSHQALETTKGDQARKTETAKTDNKIREEKNTGQVGLRTAQANSANASAAESSASAGGKALDNQQKAEIARLTSELNALNEAENPSRYKELMKRRDVLLSTKPPKELDPKVVSEGGSIYNPTTGTWETKEEYTDRINPKPAIPKNAQQLPTGFKPL